MKIGLLADSCGDIDALDRGTQLLQDAGAERLFFLGGRYPDVDALLTSRRQRRRGHAGYSDQDFVDDVAAFLGAHARPVTRSTEIDLVERLRRSFSRVPCRESLEYRDPNVPKKLVEMVGDILACLVHDKADLTKDDMQNAVLLLHGKSPEPTVVQIGPRYFVTPGRLTGAAEQTCALLDLSGGELRFSGFTLDGQTIRSLAFARGSQSKLSVK